MTAPTLKGLLYKARKDVPAAEIRESDLVYADPAPGWTTPGIYVAVVDWEMGESSVVGVGPYDPFTKKGTPRKRLMVGNEHIPEGSKWFDVHRVEWGLMLAGSRTPQPNASLPNWSRSQGRGFILQSRYRCFQPQQYQRLLLP